jgi:asparagine synthetase B (glutamine-hydrolysing)
MQIKIRFSSIRESLIDSNSKALMADVPVGVLLSGDWILH